MKTSTTSAAIPACYLSPSGQAAIAAEAARIKRELTRLRAQRMVEDIAAEIRAAEIERTRHFHSMAGNGYRWTFDPLQAVAREQQEQAMRAGEVRGVPSIFGGLK